MWYQRSGSKYKSKSIIQNGIQYHSKKEAAFAAELELRQKAKDIKSWERQVKIDLTVEGKHICNYYIDFVIHHNDGMLEYVEIKGFATDVWKIKWKMFCALYEDLPNIKLSVIK